MSGDDRKRKACDSPVPSFTLQITQHDADNFCRAAKVLESSLEKHEDDSSSTKKPLHELLFEAAGRCEDPLIASVLERQRTFKVPDVEARLGFLLFHGCDRTEKLKLLFQHLSRESSSELDQTSLGALFRSVLVSLSCCVHTPEKHIVVEGKPEAQAAEERPTKRVKLEDEPETSKPTSEDEHPEIQAGAPSGSFDSSIATLRSEDDGLHKEIEEVAAFAANQVLDFAKNESVDVGLFEDWYTKTGRTIVPWFELLELSKWNRGEKRNEAPPKQATATKEDESPASLLTETPDSSAVLSFDFSDPETPTRVVVNISEENIVALRYFVQRTGLVHQQPEELCRVVLSLCPQSKVISRSVFQRECFRLISPDALAALTAEERAVFEDVFMGYFTTFEEEEGKGVSLRELALGFSFFCSGGKSTKLALGFDLLDIGRTFVLSEQQLLRYLQSYLSMLVATSLMAPVSKQTAKRTVSTERQKLMQAAVSRGAKWTLGHFIKDAAPAENSDGFTFDTFANWYSVAGYGVAPWLELLDLQKVFPLISQSSTPARLPSFDQSITSSSRGVTPAHIKRDRVSSLRRHHSTRRTSARPEILFTFPLASHRSLVVLKDDATYVREVVERLGLLSVPSESLWESLLAVVKKRRKQPKRPEEPEYVDVTTFVNCVQEICPKLSGQTSHAGEAIVQSAMIEELLSNFFQCFDLNQTDRVAIDELMGGLSLLCGGKKSAKLAFAFSIFDTRPGAHDAKKKDRFVHSLSGEDLFLFLRSILIVTFSCCRQSLDMTDEQVGRCIADTANLICNDVMRYQWESKHLDRIDFDEFGSWYNDGGFERAPWLELLDLKKWVLVDNYETLPVKSTNNIVKNQAPEGKSSDEAGVPPPPPEDALDTSFFDENVIMPMDSIDEMDMILMQPSMDKETDIGTPKFASPKINRSFSYNSPRQQQKKKSNSLKFHLITHDAFGGYMLSVSPTRIAHLRRVILESKINSLSAETVCNEILSKATRSRLSKQSFDMAMQTLIPGINNKRTKSGDMRVVTELFASIFRAFDPSNSGRVKAIEIACGFTVLCQGKKSDKLEFAFEVLDRNKRGRLSKSDMADYLQSFLTVLLCVATSPLLAGDRSDDSLTTLKGGTRTSVTTKTLSHAVKAGAEWAAGLAFNNIPQQSSSSTSSSITFDDFAAWYTTAGYSSIPWLELLDLHKWVLGGS